MHTIGHLVIWNPLLPVAKPVANFNEFCSVCRYAPAHTAGTAGAHAPARQSHRVAVETKNLPGTK
jgi:hypothetical protein